MSEDDNGRRPRDVVLRESLAAVAHGVMAPFAALRSRHRSERSATIRTVVFVHGLLGHRAQFYAMQGWLRLAGRSRQLSYNYRTPRNLESAALALQRRLKDEVKGGRIDLVCHSMGGLIARYFVQVLGGARRVDHLVTIGTPHQGTHSAHYLPSTAVTQMRPGSEFLAQLNAQVAPPGVRCLSIAGDEDILVLPRSSAACHFGDAIMFERLGHGGLLLSPRVFRAVHEFLASK